MNSLKHRLMVSYVSLTLITLCALGGGFFLLIDRYASESDELLTAQLSRQLVAQIYDHMREGTEIGELERFVENLEQLQGAKIEVLDAEGVSVFEVYAPTAIFSLSMTPEIDEYLRIEAQNRTQPLMRMNSIRWGALLRSQSPQEHEQLLERLLSRGELQFTVAGTLQSGTLKVESTGFFKEQLLNPSIVAFSSAAVIVLILSLLLGWKISGSLTRPLKSLGDVVSHMSGGDLMVRASTVSPDDEINILAAQINQLAEELHGTIETLKEEKDRLQRFLVDASHELRTPVTALSAYLEMLAGKAGEDPQRRGAYIETCIAQNERSKDIVVHLLELLRLEQVEPSAAVRSLSAQGLMEEAVSMVEPAALGKQIILHRMQRCAADAALRGDSYQLVTALKNLLENAVKYSPEGSTVIYACTADEQQITYTVSDSGPGIDPEDIARIFDRFFRSKRAVGPGSGLGLSIVQQVVENHHGTIAVENRADGNSGVLCTMTFPLSEEIG